MLVLGREKNETIYIGDDIILTVIDFPKNGKVRLGIAAPREVPVHRGEIYEKIQRQRAAADGADVA